MGIIVVAGLGTGVGKTTATAAITHILQKSGRQVIPGKLRNFEGDVSDLKTIERLTGVPGEDFAASPDPLTRVKELSDAGNTVVIEGAGGISEPLLGVLTIADIAAELDAHLLVVSGHAKGALNLAVQAVRFARICGAQVSGVLGGALPSGADLQTRLRLMEVSKETKVPFLGSMQAGMEDLDRESFGQAAEHLMMAERWERFIKEYA
ncbi:MAG: AAA family ATPase [Corynebacterium sp.]|nr:AAA family ATPase [Corynebacterium sp.]